MSAYYFLALLGVSVAILAAVVDAILAVTRKPSWGAPRHRFDLELVHTADRRARGLPFVGVDRRDGSAALDAAASEPPRLRA